jgi:Cu-Zn family superoxide dismutase
MDGRKTLIAAVGGTALAAAALGAFATASYAGGAKVVAVHGPLTAYADPYSNGTANSTDGGTAGVHAVATPSGKTIVTLHVEGLAPNREYGSHVHKLVCDDNKAGGHYQHVPSPTTPTDPAYANPENEVWLDFTTNAAGRGSAQAVVDFVIRTGDAKAVMVHDHHTHSGGVAGAKLGCIDVPF